MNLVPKRQTLLRCCLLGTIGSVDHVSNFRAQEQYESQGDRPGLPVRSSYYGFCGHKATLEEDSR